MNEKKSMKGITAVELWDLYQKGIDYMNKITLVSDTDECHRFYSGDQWYGLKSDGEKMPMFNFIKGIVKYKVAVVAQNSMSAVYSNMGDKDEIVLQACEALNKHFNKMWELAKMDSLGWRIIKDAAIQGDSYLFSPTADVTETQIIDNVNVILGDEKNSEIQEQPYIIIIERKFVNKVKEEARRYGVNEEDIDLIVSDEDYQNQIGDKNEVDTEPGKCTCLLYMYKDNDGIVHFLRGTRTVIYQPDTILQAMDADGNAYGSGMKRYQLVNFIWEERKGTARGIGEVKQLVPNQLEVNKTLARRSVAIQQNAFGKLAYNEDAIKNPDDLDVVGAKIALSDVSATKVQDMITYLQPISMSADAKNYSDELVAVSRDLAGAGDSAQGSVDPTKASGAAIMAVRDQAALPLNEQLAKYKQFVEDLALLWYDLWVNYNPNGLEIMYEDDEAGEVQAIIDAETLERMKVNVRIDVSKNNPFSKYAQEQSLENLFVSQAITFEEYVEALDDDAAMPKAKLQDIIDKRQIQQQKDAQYEMVIQQLQGQLEQSTAVINELTGGGQGVVPAMQNGNVY